MSARVRQVEQQDNLPLEPLLRVLEPDPLRDLLLQPVRHTASQRAVSGAAGAAWMGEYLSKINVIDAL